MADEQLNQTKMAKQKNIAKPAKKEKIKAEAMPSKVEDNKEGTKNDDKTEIKEEKTEKKKEEKKTVKKTEAFVYGRSLPISTKEAVSIGKFIKFKKINYAIELLEKVIKKQIAIPMKGEIPHRKGKDLQGRSMGGGRFPQNSSKVFIKLLKHLIANSNVNGLDIDKTIIVEVVPNKASKQHHRFGNTEFKRTHVMIKSMELRRKEKK